MPGRARAGESLAASAVFLQQYHHLPIDIVHVERNPGLRLGLRGALGCLGGGLEAYPRSKRAEATDGMRGLGFLEARAVPITNLTTSQPQRCLDQDIIWTCCTPLLTPEGSARVWVARQYRLSYRTASDRSYRTGV